MNDDRINSLRDEYNRRIVSQAEFEAGMTDVARRKKFQEPTNQASANAYENAKYTGRPVGRRQRFDELEQTLARKMMSEDPRIVELAREKYREFYGGLPGDNVYKRPLQQGFRMEVSPRR